MKLARQSGYRDLLWDKEGCPDWERAHFDGKTDKVVTICTRYPCREIEIVFCDKVGGGFYPPVGLSYRDQIIKNHYTKNSHCRG